jgi:hypothetical protein
MAFENPFLQPSNVRKSALAYLWSDDKDDIFNINNVDSNSVVGNAFSVQAEADQATNIALNIANNDGSFNPNDSTDYGGGYAQSNPVEAFNAVTTYGPMALSLLGVPFAGAISSGMQQAAANNVIGLVDGFVSQYGGQTVDTMSPAMAALIGINPVVSSILGKSDSVETAKGLVDAFQTTGAMAGYFSAALDPTISQIAQGMVADPTSVTPAQFGTLGQSISESIQDNVASGKSLNEAYNIAIETFNPPVAVSVPVSTPALPIGTPLGPAGGFQGATDAQVAAANESSDPIGSLIGSIEANNPTAPAAPAPTTGMFGGSTAPNQSDTYGGYVSDSQNQAVQTSSGPLGFGDAPASSAPAGNNPDEADPGDTGGGGGGSSKIICTAMNEAYGFGSFRNAIWIKYANQHLTKEHEKGYHALFLPLVDYGFKQGDGTMNKIVRKVLEWGTRHRSTDLRAEMRGKKRDTTGRIIRAIFEPLCYFVGKYK